MEKVQYIISNLGNVSLWIRNENGESKAYTMAADHPSHKFLIEKLKNKDYENLEELINPKTVEVIETKQALKKMNEELESSPLVGKAEIRNDQVYVNNVPVHNVISERIMELYRKGYPFEPVLRFLENVLMNPSSKSQEELYDFLANKNLPLTEDGCFLAYKKVRHNWMDVYSGTFDNSPGKTVSIPREMVDDDRGRECSHGLHVGGWNYVQIYGNDPKNRIVICKVNPRHCVSVPRDHNHEKLRVHQYDVLYEMNDALENPVYTASGEKFASLKEHDDHASQNESHYFDEYWAEGWDDEEEEDWEDSWAEDEDGWTFRKLEAEDNREEEDMMLESWHNQNCAYGCEEHIDSDSRCHVCESEKPDLRTSTIEYLGTPQAKAILSGETFIDGELKVGSVWMFYSTGADFIHNGRKVVIAKLDNNVVSYFPSLNSINEFGWCDKNWFSSNFKKVS